MTKFVFEGPICIIASQLWILNRSMYKKTGNVIYKGNSMTGIHQMGQYTGALYSGEVKVKYYFCIQLDGLIYEGLKR